MYYKNILRFLSGSLILLGSVAFSSCSEEELNSKELKLFVNTGGSVINEKEMTLLHTPGNVEGAKVFTFNIKATRSLTADATVSFEVDNSLIEAYNKKNETNFEPLDETLCHIENAQLKILAGEMKSADSVKVSFPETESMSSKKGYLVPVRMSQIKSVDKGLRVSSNMNVVYIRIENSFVSIDPAGSSVEGTKIDPTNWSVTSNSIYGDFIAENMIDGDYESYWFGMTYTGNPILTFTMDKKHTLTGFRMVPCYSMWGPGYAVAKMQVYTSEDGENWTSQGDISLHRPAAGSSAANPDFHYVRFYFPVEATHFRFQIKETHTESFGAINEVEAYE